MLTGTVFGLFLGREDHVVATSAYCRLCRVGLVRSGGLYVGPAAPSRL